MKKKCDKKCGGCSCHDNQLPLKVHLGAAGNVILKKVAAKKDGSVNIDYDCDEQFIEFYKSESGAKTVTKTGLAKFIKELLKNKIDKIIESQ